MSQQQKTEIIHDAIVRSINENSVTVTLLNNDCCSGCQSEKVCGIAGKEVKTIKIPGKFQLIPGNKVTVIMKLSDGYLALFLGYLLPLLIFLSFLVVLNALSVSELYSGLIALGTLIPYYLIFSLFRKSINTRFSFNLKS
jgi:positive regulator of sigma E activity